MEWYCRCGIWSKSYLVGESLESVPPSPTFPTMMQSWTHVIVPSLTANSDEAFTSYRTAQYKLHLYETLTGYRFVLLSDPSARLPPLRSSDNSIPAHS